MLRSSLSKPLFRRQFSTSSASWNVHRPIGDQNLPSNPQPHEPVHPLSQDTLKAKPADPNPLPTSHEHLPPYDLELVRGRIREWTEQATIALRNRADDFTESTKTTFSQLGSQLNRVTGYEQIEVLKRSVVEQEERINIAREAARSAKGAYEEAVIQRSNSQREVNDLLQRKSTWTDGDVGRFTSLVRQDHLYEQEETRAKEAVQETENAVEREFSELLRTILARYHEEQVWSDKIRSASTYGSLAALGLNMLVFIMAIVVVEPWKRKRLAQTFETKVEELSSENKARLDASMKSIGQQIAQQGSIIESLKESLEEDVLNKLRVTLQPIEEPDQLKTNEVIRSLHFSRREWEAAMIGTGAFVAGILGTVIFSR